MTIDIEAAPNRNSYTTRRADNAWLQTMQILANPDRKKVVDLGCGGGLYSRAWADLRVKEVIGIDFSRQMISDALQACLDVPNATFQVGTMVEASGLPSESADIVFSRAVLHHLAGLAGCFAESRRLLKPGGTVIIQERTPEDVRLPGSREHIRGHFFTALPRLLETDAARRPTRQSVEHELSRAGFINIQAMTLWEVRKTHVNREELGEDLHARTGRPILQELSSQELDTLIQHVLAQLPAGKPIIEKESLDNLDCEPQGRGSSLKPIARAGDDFLTGLQSKSQRETRIG